jgi:amino acid adenylation domain-containing protein
MTVTADISPLVATVVASGPAGASQPAITLRDRSLSYGELRRDVIAVSEWLRKRGCRSGDRVALYLPKTIETVELVLGILAAGAAYVPLNPHLPHAAVRQILHDLEPFLLITDAAASRKLCDGPDALMGIRIATVGGSGFPLGLELVAPDGAGRGAMDAAFDDLAVLLYTSGSTGVPKGIALSHRNVMSFVDWAGETFAMSSADQVTSHAPLHFDLSTFDLFCTLSRHGTIHLIDEPTTKFAGAVRNLIAERRVSVWYSVPTALMQLQERNALGGLDSLRLVLFAGEVFPVPALRRVMEALPAPDYANLYGPTETNVCTYYRLPGMPAADAEFLPIGLPCEHLDVSILDTDGNDVAPGETGEICVAGPAVMQGYWNRAELTRASRVAGRRDSYRTGDYGYRRADGMIMYSGRRDQQVKVRGHRIELLALEAALNAHPEVKEAVAVVASDARGGAMLQAFIVARQQPVAAAEIARHIGSRLAPYYQPDRVEWLDEMPRTSSGKCDRVSLLSRARSNIGEEVK